MSAVNGRVRSLLSKMSQRSLSFSSPLVLLGALGMTPLAYAEAVKLNIPAQSLASALREFGQQSGMQLLYEPALVEGKRAAAVSGEMDSADGLKRILQGTGIRYHIENGAVFLTAPSDSSALELGATNINGDALGATTEGSASYTTGAVSIGKSAQSLKEIPQSVTVMTRQRIEDQNLSTLNDVLNQTPGVTLLQGTNLDSRYYSRGFQITSMRVDGGSTFRGPGNGEGNIDMALYDHVEILRGVDGLYAGSGEPGGSVNLVRKRPTSTLQTKILAQGGSWSTYRTDLDVGGPLAFDGKLRGRTVVSYQDKGSFQEGAGTNKKLFYGVLDADLTDSLTVMAGLSRELEDAAYQGYGLPRTATGEDLKLSRSTFLSGSNDSQDKATNTYFVRADQALGEDWKLSVDGTYKEMTQHRDNFFFNGSVNPQTGAGLSGFWTKQAENYKDRSIDIALKGGFDLFSGRHDLVVGWSRKELKTTANVVGLNDNTVIPNIYTFDPSDYRDPSAAAVPLYSLPAKIVESGLYSSLRLQLAEPLHLILGGRYSKYDYYSGFHSLNAQGQVSGVADTKYTENDVFTPFAAVTFDLNDEWTTYVSAAEIYKSQANMQKGPEPGSPLDAITGKNYELGIKGELLGGRLNTSAALYYIKREGEAIRDNSYTQVSGPQGERCCFLGDGEIVSKGVDLEVSGEMFPRLQTSVGYTFNNNENRSDGARYSSVTPKHLFKVFGSYQLSGVLEPLRVGGGVTAQSGSYISEANYVAAQSGYAIWSSFAEYRVNPHWTVALNGNNLLDKKYYSTAGYNTYGNFYGDPRNFMLTLRGSY